MRLFSTNIRPTAADSSCWHKTSLGYSQKVDLTPLEGRLWRCDGTLSIWLHTTHISSQDDIGAWLSIAAITCKDRRCCREQAEDHGDEHGAIRMGSGSMAWRCAWAGGIGLVKYIFFSSRLSKSLVDRLRFCPSTSRSMIGHAWTWINQ